MTYTYDSGHMLRIPQHLANMELDALVEWREQTVRHFGNRVRDLDKRNDTHPDAYWDEDLGGGMTRGELAAEQRNELLGFAELSDEFGIVTAWAILERFLFQLFKDIKHFNLLVSPDTAKKKSLDFKGYRAMLREIGVDIAASPVQYRQLLKLRAIRVTLTHYGGWVTYENEKEMRPYGFKLDQRIELPDHYFTESVGLIRGSCKQIMDLCIPVLKAHITTKRVKRRLKQV